MLRLLQGVANFHDNILPGMRETFATLGEGQQPDALMWSCIDSRVVPNLFASSHPGELNMQRNPGNIVPPYSRGVSGTKAAISLAMRKFPIQDMVVCGHFNCGAMGSLMDWENAPPDERQWLQLAQSARIFLDAGLTLDADLNPVDQLSQLNVLVQLSHLQTYPQVASAMAAGALRVHGWWFHVGKGEVMSYEPDERKFVPIDKHVGAKILQRISHGQSSIPTAEYQPWNHLVHQSLKAQPGVSQRAVARAVHVLRWMQRPASTLFHMGAPTGLLRAVPK